MIELVIGVILALLIIYFLRERKNKIAGCSGDSSIDYNGPAAGITGCYCKKGMYWNGNVCLCPTGMFYKDQTCVADSTASATSNNNVLFGIPQDTTESLLWSNLFY